jgi:hypothetical protein
VTDEGKGSGSTEGYSLASLAGCATGLSAGAIDSFTRYRN